MHYLFVIAEGSNPLDGGSVKCIFRRSSTRTSIKVAKECLASCDKIRDDFVATMTSEEKESQRLAPLLPTAHDEESSISSARPMVNQWTTAALHELAVSVISKATGRMANGCLMRRLFAMPSCR